MVINSMFLAHSREHSILGHRPFCKGYYFQHFLIDTSRTIFPDTPIWAGNTILFLDFNLIRRFFAKLSQAYCLDMSLSDRFKENELVRRLAWLVAQDGENYRLQLESAVKCKPNSSSSWEHSRVCCLLPKTIPFPGMLPDCLISVFQGFSSTSYSANDALCVILACEMWTGLNFMLEDIAEGKLKEHLQPEDYDLDK